MPSYPNTIKEFREIKNKSGVVYDQTKSTVMYAEDIQSIDEEIVAIEETLGTNPEGDHESVKDRLDSFDLAILITKNIISTSWENLDKIQKSLTGTITSAFARLTMTTPASTDGEVWINTETSYINEIDFNSEICGFNTSLGMSAAYGSQLYFGMGQNPLVGDENGFGFKVISGTLYACIWKYGSGETAQSIPGITLTDYNNYRVEYKPAESIKFYVNNILKLTYLYNVDVFPVGDNPVPCAVNFKTTNNTAKSIYLEQFAYWHLK